MKKEISPYSYTYNGGIKLHPGLLAMTDEYEEQMESIREMDPIREIEEYDMDDINITKNAALRLKEIRVKEELESVYLRIYIQGGGCSGFQYGFAIDQDKDDNDLILEKHNEIFVIDPISLPYLHGATIDYVEDVMSSRFEITNPNVSNSCGCGSSFTF